MFPASNIGAASTAPRPHTVHDFEWTCSHDSWANWQRRVGAKGSVYAKFSSASFRGNSDVADVTTYGLQQQAAGKHGDANRPVPCGSPRDRQGSLYLRLPNGDQLQNHENRKAKRLTS